VALDWGEGIAPCKEREDSMREKVNTWARFLDKIVYNGVQQRPGNDSSSSHYRIITNEDGTVYVHDTGYCDVEKTLQEIRDWFYSEALGPIEELENMIYQLVPYKHESYTNLTDAEEKVYSKVKSRMKKLEKKRLWKI